MEGTALADIILECKAFAQPLGSENTWASLGDGKFELVGHTIRVMCDDPPPTGPFGGAEEDGEESPVEDGEQVASSDKEEDNEQMDRGGTARKDGDDEATNSTNKEGGLTPSSKDGASSISEDAEDQDEENPLGARQTTEHHAGEDEDGAAGGADDEDSAVLLHHSALSPSPVIVLEDQITNDTPFVAKDGCLVWNRPERAVSLCIMFVSEMGFQAAWSALLSMQQNPYPPLEFDVFAPKAISPSLEDVATPTSDSQPPKPIGAKPVDPRENTPEAQHERVLALLQPAALLKYSYVERHAIALSIIEQDHGRSPNFPLFKDVASCVSLLKLGHTDLLEYLASEEIYPCYIQGMEYNGLLPQKWVCPDGLSSAPALGGMINNALRLHHLKNDVLPLHSDEEVVGVVDALNSRLQNEIVCSLIADEGMLSEIIDAIKQPRLSPAVMQKDGLSESEIQTKRAEEEDSICVKLKFLSNLFSLTATAFAKELVPHVLTKVCALGVVPALGDMCTHYLAPQQKQQLVEGLVMTMPAVLGGRNLTSANSNAPSDAMNSLGSLSEGPRSPLNGTQNSEQLGSTFGGLEDLGGSNTSKSTSKKEKKKDKKDKKSRQDIQSPVDSNEGTSPSATPAAKREEQTSSLKEASIGSGSRGSSDSKDSTKKDKKEKKSAKKSGDLDKTGTTSTLNGTGTASTSGGTGTGGGGRMQPPAAVAFSQSIEKELGKLLEETVNRLNEKGEERTLTEVFRAAIVAEPERYEYFMQFLLRSLAQPTPMSTNRFLLYHLLGMHDDEGSGCDRKNDLEALEAKNAFHHFFINNILPDAVRYSPNTSTAMGSSTQPGSRGGLRGRREREIQDSNAQQVGAMSPGMVRLLEYMFNTITDENRVHLAKVCFGPRSGVVRYILKDLPVMSGSTAVSSSLTATRTFGSQYSPTTTVAAGTTTTMNGAVIVPSPPTSKPASPNPLSNASLVSNGSDNTPKASPLVMAATSKGPAMSGGLALPPFKKEILVGHVRFVRAALCSYKDSTIVRSLFVEKDVLHPLLAMFSYNRNKRSMFHCTVLNLLQTILSKEFLLDMRSMMMLRHRSLLPASFVQHCEKEALALLEVKMKGGSQDEQELAVREMSRSATPMNQNAAILLDSSYGGSSAGSHSSSSLLSGGHSSAERKRERVVDDALPPAGSPNPEAEQWNGGLSAQARRVIGSLSPTPNSRASSASIEDQEGMGVPSNSGGTSGSSGSVGELSVAALSGGLSQETTNLPSPNSKSPKSSPKSGSGAPPPKAKSPAPPPVSTVSDVSSKKSTSGGTTKKPQAPSSPRQGSGGGVRRKSAGAALVGPR